MSLDSLLGEILSPSAPIIRELASDPVAVSALSSRLRDRSFEVVEWEATGEPDDSWRLLDTLFRSVVGDRLYSGSWDALEERLADVAANPHQRVALLVANALRFALNDPEQWSIALAVLSGIGEEWRRAGSVLRVIVLR